MTAENRGADLNRRRKRVLDPLETVDEPTAAFVNLIKERVAKIAAELEAEKAHCAN
ncbi:hypothetical protein [Actinomadura rayongensis]|uniref:Uncharacterized protein n=1 Tax=Actinomadura rayongensis TaxID=1429076 RepID=A0A6I4W5V6_9ACTN|nr:hypothetical protein [Actinomadura rayongensis]MXQ64861.1 hypothetical protein [Actinomadura rayongensis]